MIRALYRAVVGMVAVSPLAWGDVDFGDLGQRFNGKIAPIVSKYCLDCHAADTKKGELDLEQFAGLEQIRKQPATWQHIVEQLESGEMPPKDKPQLEEEERKTLLGWIDEYLDAEALASAGDPGPVLLRRLSNAEYTYTVRDLTGVESLDPAAQFPVDSAAGEGFTNTGSALMMSPALLEKYLQAGKEIARHAVLLPDGIRFSPHVTRRDRSDAIVEQIRAAYRKVLGVGAIDFSYTGLQVGSERPVDLSDGRLDYERYVQALLKHRDRLLGNLKSAGAIAGEEELNAKYFAILADCFFGTAEDGGFIVEDLRNKVRTASRDQAASIVATIEAWQSSLFRFNKVGHLGPVQRWQVPVSMTGNRRDFSIKPPDGDAVSFEVTLSAHSVGGNEEGTTVLWENPRLIRPGAAPLKLEDVRGAAAVFDRFRDELLAKTSRFFEACYEAKRIGDEIDVAPLAQRHQLEPDELALFMAYLGIQRSTQTVLSGYLTEQRKNIGGHEAVDGWGLPGHNDLSILGNASDSAWRIPGSTLR